MLPSLSQFALSLGASGMRRQPKWPHSPTDLRPRQGSLADSGLSVVAVNGHLNFVSTADPATRAAPDAAAASAVTGKRASGSRGGGAGAGGKKRAADQGGQDAAAPAPAAAGPKAEAGAVGVPRRALADARPRDLARSAGAPPLARLTHTHFPKSPLQARFARPRVQNGACPPRRTHPPASASPQSVQVLCSNQPLSSSHKPHLALLLPNPLFRRSPPLSTSTSTTSTAGTRWPCTRTRRTRRVCVFFRWEDDGESAACQLLQRGVASSAAARRSRMGVLR